MFKRNVFVLPFPHTSTLIKYNNTSQSNVFVKEKSIQFCNNKTFICTYLLDSFSYLTILINGHSEKREINLPFYPLFCLIWKEFSWQLVWINFSKNFIFKIYTKVESKNDKNGVGLGPDYRTCTWGLSPGIT